MSLAFYRSASHVWTIEELNDIWLNAIKIGAISGDLNLDGDFDDIGQLEITKPDILCSLLEIPLKYIDRHFPPDSSEQNGRYCIAAWFNPNTNFTHFVVGDGKGKVFYDPIYGGSKTVREGYVKSLRLYERI